MSNVNQIFDYPKGARVEAITPILCHLGSIPSGTKGTVTGHCDDGRAWVFFDDYEAGHTFHEPERSIRVIEQPSHEQSASASVKQWYRVYDGPSRPMIETDDGRLLSVSQFQSGRWESYQQEDSDIESIVCDHNEHQHCATQLQFLANRAEELSSLLAGMTTERDGLRDQLRKVQEEHRQNSQSYGFADCGCSYCQVVKPVLNHAEQGEGS